MAGPGGDVDIAAAARLLAEPARAALVLGVMDGGALPAGALAARAGIAASTASEHLARLVDGSVLVVEPEGRLRRYRLAGPAVADAVEALAAIAPRPAAGSLREASRGERLRFARTCYDHLAGQVGVALASCLERDRVVIRRDGTYELGPRAGARLATLGVELSDLQRLRRPVVRGCLDWSERELHVAGGVGAALAVCLYERGWIRRRERDRSVEVTAEGRAALAREFGIDLDAARAA